MSRDPAGAGARPEPGPFSHWLRKRLRLLYGLALLGIASPWLSRALEPRPTLAWLTDLATHWQFAYVTLAMLAAAVAWRGLARLAAVVALAPGLWGLWWLMPPLAPGADAPAAQTLRLVTANVHVGTDEPDALLVWARTQQADVVMLQEINPAFAKALEARAGDYPFRHLAPRDDPFGIGLLSRHPLRDARLEPGPGGLPTLRATVEMPGGPVPVVVVHPFPPLSAETHRERANTVQQLESRASAEASLVVGGDFNASPWSSAFAGVEHLHLASRGLPTWHGVLPIDHVLVGKAWSQARATRAPAMASDHRGLFVELAR
ncbi:MAG: endonuclease/exonuclease/phosphatase family protein [Rhodocyclaceae bacterium]|nr:endonuclease/exonuclease/phosphatase family protein [Rhodocyclaceae bacterium]